MRQAFRLDHNDLYNISIHAPIVGCDIIIAVLIYTIFISIHAPIVGCDFLNPYVENEINISIHAPIVGCDFDWCLFINFPLNISIHAPIVGCDYICLVSSARYLNFNPRTHRGVRHNQPLKCRHNVAFQSTHPSWGATNIHVPTTFVIAISIHAPIVGCDAIPPFSCYTVG